MRVMELALSLRDHDIQWIRGNLRIFVLLCFLEDKVQNCGRFSNQPECNWHLGVTRAQPTSTHDFIKTMCSSLRHATNSNLRPVSMSNNHLNRFVCTFACGGSRKRFTKTVEDIILARHITWKNAQFVYVSISRKHQF